MADYGKARKTAEQAFMLMQRHLIDPTPANVMAWFVYAEGIHPDWNRKLDQLLASKDLLSAREKDEIICHFLLSIGNCKTIFNTMNGVYSVISSAASQISAAGEETSAFGKKLSMRADDLRSAKGEGAANKIVAAILGDTEEMAKKYQDVAEKLKEASDAALLLQSKLEEARKQAVTDPLSGLANRRYFDARLRELAEEADQTGIHLCMMMIDIDFFKPFNDAHGHQAGDEVIKLVANFLTGTIRAEDLAARYGGDEFAVFLPRMEFDQAVSLAERFRKKLSSRPIIKRGDKKAFDRVTVSAGVTIHHAGETLEDFVKRADKALYMAKERGRNVVVWID